MLQIGTALFYYKLGQTLLQIGVALLLQIGASVVTNWGSYYKLGQLLLQNREAITNWGKMYYKLRHNIVIHIKLLFYNVLYIESNSCDEILLFHSPGVMQHNFALEFHTHSLE